MVIGQVLGLAYLVMHPSQLKHLVIKHTRYKHRNQTKPKWIEWQKYNSSRIEAALKAHGAEALLRPFNVARIQTISNMVLPLGKGLQILDVGGGDGLIGEHLWKMQNNIATIDLPTVSAQSHKREFLFAVTGDAEELPFKLNGFDVVIASEIVEHLWDPNSFLDDAYKILKTGGHLIISTPDGVEGLRYDSHKHYYTVEILEKLLASRFSLVQMKRLTDVGTPTPTIIVMFQKI
ncbi:MAG: class I SAM-dependent methyltransferase [Candidatus Bathyarchaeota archaeon]|nr:class I SAM-dependent methyltransferase [Candidatus Bathyarchaeum tardum]WGM90000.1 MAG: class I SAM-dependent methyltransferase [Candidatus Bathyarchaeum tardum]WNZ29861.1 MAG: class I SAM-dependent methyltransferase [Candidatus Bathyarchaeota archaeon]